MILGKGAALAAVGLSLLAVPGAANARPASAITTVSLPGLTAQAIAVDPVTGTAYVAGNDYPSGAVEVVDLATGTITATITVGFRPEVIAVNQATDTVYAAEWSKPRVISVINGVTNAVTSTISLPGGHVPVSMAIDAATNTAYVGSNGSVYVLDLATNTIVATITGAAGSVFGIADNATTHTVYAAGESGNILVIDTATNTVTRTVTLTGEPEALALSPGGDRLYVTSWDGVVAYDTRSWAVDGSAHVAHPSISTAVDPVTGTVYSAVSDGSGHDYLGLIDSAATSVTGQIPVPGPGWVAVGDADTLLAAVNGPAGAALWDIHLTAPGISSRANVTFTTGKAGTFAVTATGTPESRFTENGRLPGGVTLSAGGALSGTPKAGTGGVYPITITASNGVAPAATQRFTLTVDEAPAITSANHVTFAHGRRGSFTVRTEAFPAASVTERGALPPGLRFAAGKNGTATISGIPARSARGKTYLIRLTARNGAGPAAVQRLSLRVS